ncbi:lipid-A-disaccharide synthase N-terminal domain-containing protein [Methylomonas sp. MED-D]|uniref:Lipid A biosynthesis protein n=1 Tax=Methylomonas koyamae TaxID=702114 RepID=A0A177N272_9GAMM|nr:MULTISPECIES: lipid-A-disaccharide synthase N-terminal domain-containing protein [Methylomonas]MDT4330928.1 lipid-A-disaccharide synthase N-terminal domain-containing protein [Methylomonas sp. MV1]NJA07549.1 lipid A biosynthesis protein [Methylococcaceae bacterium WWC4]OAI11951.1 lipid A biosynthesis protein [Methylomonas koyamae]WGS84920.1 lipid-A-disaccharide synthase N-terminal domain-containing protein [Methylomonas sp. UP202]
MDNDTLWLIVGFLGQGLFSARFLVQWLASERQKRSVIPTMFWYFSIFGGVTLLVYSIHKQDPVFILGQGMGLLIYFRNLYFVLRHPRAGDDSGQA